MVMIDDDLLSAWEETIVIYSKMIFQNVRELRKTTKKIQGSSTTSQLRKRSVNV
jgi:hypothetical protein